MYANMAFTSTLAPGFTYRAHAPDSSGRVLTCGSAGEALWAPPRADNWTQVLNLLPKTVLSGTHAARAPDTCASDTDVRCVITTRPDATLLQRHEAVVLVRVGDSAEVAFQLVSEALPDKWVWLHTRPTPLHAMSDTAVARYMTSLPPGAITHGSVVAACAAPAGYTLTSDATGRLSLAHVADTSSAPREWALTEATPVYPGAGVSRAPPARVGAGVWRRTSADEDYILTEPGAMVGTLVLSVLAIVAAVGAGIFAALPSARPAAK